MKHWMSARRLLLALAGLALVASGLVARAATPAVAGSAPDGFSTLMTRGAQIRPIWRPPVLPRCLETQYQSSPPRHDYHLTAAGRELVPAMHALRAWSDTWAVSEPPLRAEHHGHPIRPYVACATCGEPVREGELEFISTVPDWDITGPQRPAEAPGDESSATTPHRRRPAHQSATNRGRTEEP